MRRALVVLILAFALSGCEVSFTIPFEELKIKPLIRDGCSYPAECTATIHEV